jgi:hypothetical protein
MHRTTVRPCRARVAAPLLLLLVAGGITGCGDPLDVSDPTAILDDEVSTPEGAELLRRGALSTLYSVIGRSAFEGGLLADEFLTQPSSLYTDVLQIPSPDELWDRRETMQYYETLGSTQAYDWWQELWLRRTAVALDKLLAYALPGAREAHTGEMFAVRGFAGVRLAEDFCAGFPLHAIEDMKLVYGPPLSTEEAFEHALAALDSALAWAADSARVLNFARVARGRALLNLGRFAEAAAAVQDVPTDYVYQNEYTFNDNPLAATATGWALEGLDEGRRSVADREGGNGLDFVSANDPRVPTDSVGTTSNGALGLYTAQKYPSGSTPIVIASGIEARLIEAEAALRANDLPTWLGKLNALRATVGLVDTTDPGSDAARVDLTFRERAFWLFGTGHRLGDLRRLIRHHGRDSESVLPSGPHWRTGVYGSGTSFPFSKNEVAFSPGVTGCTE